MREQVWPRYAKLLDRSSFALLGVVFSPQAFKSLAIAGGLIAIYLVGLFTPIPTLRPAPDGPQTWWFFALLDQVFTGGAAGRGSLFCLGMVSVFSLGNILFRFFNKMIRAGTLAAVATLVYALMGRVDLDFIVLAKTFFYIAVGGYGVAAINNWLMRYRGPQAIHINISILLYLHFSELAAKLIRSGHTSELYLTAAGVLFMMFTSYFIFRMRFFLEVVSIRSRADQRTAVLELRGVDEVTLEQLGFANITLFCLAAGFVSLIFGWRAWSIEIFPQMTALSVFVLLVVSAVLALTNRILTSRDDLFRHVRELLDSTELAGFHSPHRYATRMIQYFWVVPNVRAGLETEKFIERKIKRVLGKAMAFLLLWYLVALGIEAYTIHLGSGTFLFPYGALTFSSLFLILAGYGSVLLRLLGTRWNQLRQMTKGKSRVAAQTFPLSAPGELAQLDLAQSDTEYWEEERLGEQIRDLLDWYRLMRETLPAPRTRQPTNRKVRLIALCTQVVIALVSGLVLATLGGMLYVAMTTDPDDIWEVVIPLFLGGLFTPNALWNLSKWRRHERSEQDSGFE